jgi:hypothetical protein
MRRFLPEGDLPCGVFDAVKSRFLPRILIGNFTAAKNIVLAGQGIRPALPFQLKREIDDGDCVLLPLELPWLSLNYGFIPNAVEPIRPPSRRSWTMSGRLKKDCRPERTRRDPP